MQEEGVSEVLSSGYSSRVVLSPRPRGRFPDWKLHVSDKRGRPLYRRWMLRCAPLFYLLFPFVRIMQCGLKPPLPPSTKRPTSEFSQRVQAVPALSSADTTKREARPPNAAPVGTVKFLFALATSLFFWSTDSTLSGRVYYACHSVGVRMLLFYPMIRSCAAGKQAVDSNSHLCQFPLMEMLSIADLLPHSRGTADGKVPPTTSTAFPAFSVDGPALTVLPPPPKQLLAAILWEPIDRKTRPILLPRALSFFRFTLPLFFLPHKSRVVFSPFGPPPVDVSK